MLRYISLGYPEQTGKQDSIMIKWPFWWAYRVPVFDGCTEFDIPKPWMQENEYRKSTSIITNLRLGHDQHVYVWNPKCFSLHWKLSITINAPLCLMSNLSPRTLQASMNNQGMIILSLKFTFVELYCTCVYNCIQDSNTHCSCKLKLVEATVPLWHGRYRIPSYIPHRPRLQIGCITWLHPL